MMKNLHMKLLRLGIMITIAEIHTENNIDKEAAQEASRSTQRGGPFGQCFGEGTKGFTLRAIYLALQREVQQPFIEFGFVEDIPNREGAQLFHHIRSQVLLRVVDSF
jgi:hypothetical protein